MHDYNIIARHEIIQSYMICWQLCVEPKITTYIILMENLIGLYIIILYKIIIILNLQ